MVCKMEEENSDRNVKFKRATSDDDLRENKKIKFFVNDYYLFDITVNENPKKDIWSFCHVQKSGKRPTHTANIRESANARKTFAKEVASLDIMNKKEFDNILIETASRVNGLLNTVKPFESNESEFENTESSLVFDENKRMYEEIWDPTNGGRFIYMNDSHPYTKLEVNGVRPYDDDALRLGAVLLPTGIEDYGSVEELIDDIKKHIQKYLDVSDDFRTFSAYYVLLSWVYERVNTLAYLRVLGDSGCGKSRFLDVVGRLCYKVFLASGSVTPAPIYRMIKRYGGSISLDEADFKDSDEKNEIVKILNCGFEKNRPVTRCKKDDPDDLQILPTFGPKVLATRSTFKDKALESRCITEIMKPTNRKDIPPILPDGFYYEEEELRNKLLKFRFDYFNKIDTKEIELLDLGDIELRIKQATLSFAVLFRNIKEMMCKFKIFLKKYNDDLIVERSESYDGMIVNALHSLGFEEGNVITAQTVTDHLKDKNNIETTARTVGRHFKSLGLVTKLQKIDGKVKRNVTFEESIWSRLKERYIPGEKGNVGNESNDSIGCEPQKFFSPPNTNITIQEKNEENNLSPEPPKSVTNVTNVTDKLELWRKDGRQNIPTKVLESEFGIGITELQYLLDRGLIQEVRPGLFDNI